MAASEDFVITDTQKRDIFRDNNPEGNNFWIVTRRNFDTVFMCPYDTNNNMITGNFILITLNDLNAGYTYVRRNPVDPLHGGRKRRSLKSRKSRQSKRRVRRTKRRKH